MSQAIELPPSLTGASAKIPAGATLSLRLSLRNEMNEIVLLHPILDDWVSDSGQIFSTVERLAPSYIYLERGREASQTISVDIPSDLQPGQFFKSWLRFPGLQETAIPVKIEIVPAGSPPNKTEAVDLPVPVTLPLPGEPNKLFGLEPDPTTAGIFGLMAGLIDLDKIPSRWLAAELLAILAQKGEEYAQTQAGGELLARLKGTGFFQNGARAFASAQLPVWISQSLSAASAALVSQVGKGRLLEIWERWLLNLAHTDLEAGASRKEISVPPLFAEGFADKMGGDGERWFAAIVSGLAVVSPRIAGMLEACATGTLKVAAPTGAAERAGYALATGLAGLEGLSARWLAAELLLVLAQKGEERATTEAGSRLLAQLGRTRFFKNGVLALAGAQAPRWLAVSQSAASAYHASTGGLPGQQGMLYLWEQWLWGLLEADWLAGELRGKIRVPDFAGGSTVSALGGNADLWFGAWVLALAQVSPRFAAVVGAIAPDSAAPAAPVAPEPVFDDVLGERRSIQR
ncbi:MAG: hypothetical protein KME26_00575 [Oscillatoria princeps RMCB-10]|jgi:hypothetical protein|nr:hypothetical protein [Oscillatoria princeps RMCB-10]